jgi:signal transduction histidine kinase
MAPKITRPCSSTISLLNAVNYSHNDSHHRSHNRTCRYMRTQPWLAVRDHGIGIPSEKLPRIFDDYYRTNEAVQHNRTSTGLGLAIVRHVARSVTTGVEIQVESAPGWGTRVTVTIPILAHPTLTNQPPLTPYQTPHYGLPAHRR